MNDLPNTLIEGVLDISRQAGAAIMGVYERPDLGIQTKSDDSPLTEADLAANEIIVRGLKDLDSTIPILSEESKAVAYADRRDWGRFWLVDPLDGTKEFIRRNGEFTVNIALIERSAPVFGVVHVPAQNRTYWGGPNIPSQVEDESGRRDIYTTVPSAGPAIVVVSRSHLSEDDESFIAKLSERYDGATTTPSGSSLKLCLVAEGRAHAYPRFGPTMEWDTAAAHAVLLGAGGVVHKADGSGPLAYNKENLLNPFFIARARELELS